MEEVVEADLYQKNVAGESDGQIENLGLVSIIVPVYNVETYLAECVESVLNQTYPYFELLLIDDGSWDNSPAICDAFAQIDLRVKVIHKKNQGPSATRNLGIEKAAGAYIVFIDSDDFVGKEMLEKMIRAITRYQTDLVICGYERFQDSWRIKYRLSPYSLVILQSLMELASVYKQPKSNMFGISIWAKMYRRDIIWDNQIRFQEEINYEEDCLFNLDYFRYVTTTAVLRDYFYSYRQLDSSLSKGYRKNSFQFLVNGYRNRIALLKELGMETKGAMNIFLMVVKATFIKIFNSSLTKEEKMEEYKKLMAFIECRDVCINAEKSRSRLTRLLARSVVEQNEQKAHYTLCLWQLVVKVKAATKKVLRRFNK